MPLIYTKADDSLYNADCCVVFNNMSAIKNAYKNIYGRKNGIIYALLPDENADICACYGKILKKAVKRGYESVSIPLLSKSCCSAGQKDLHIAVNAITDFVKKNDITVFLSLPEIDANLDDPCEKEIENIIKKIKVDEKCELISDIMPSPDFPLHFSPLTSDVTALSFGSGECSVLGNDTPEHKEELDYAFSDDDSYGEESGSCLTDVDFSPASLQMLTDTSGNMSSTIEIESSGPEPEPAFAPNPFFGSDAHDEPCVFSSPMTDDSSDDVLPPVSHYSFAPAHAESEMEPVKEENKKAEKKKSKQQPITHYAKKNSQSLFTVTETEDELENLLRNMDESFADMLIRKIDEKGLTDPECYRRANIDRRVFARIIHQNNYTPKKPTILALAVSLELTKDETDDFLRKAGYAFNPNSQGDMIVQFFIENRVYDIDRINLSLFKHDQYLLGSVVA